MGGAKSKNKSEKEPEPETSTNALGQRTKTAEIEKQKLQKKSLSQKSLKCYITCLNWFILLGSVCLFVVSIMIATRFPISGGSGNFVMYGPMVISFLTGIYALMALRGNVTKPSTRACYFITVVIAAFIILIAGIIAVMYVYYAEKSATQSSTEYPKGSGSEMMIQNNDYSMALFNECCAKNKAYNLSMVLPCVENSLSCPQQWSVDVYGCGCIQDPDTYKYISDEITGSMCKKLQKTKVDIAGQGSIYMIGPPEEYGCGGGNPKRFQYIVYLDIEDKLRPLGITYCIVGTVLFLGAFLAFCCVLGKKTEEKEKAAEQDQLVEMKDKKTKKTTEKRKQEADNARMAYDSLEEDTGYYDDDAGESAEANPFADPDQGQGEDQLTMA